MVASRGQRLNRTISPFFSMIRFGRAKECSGPLRTYQHEERRIAQGIKLYAALAAAGVLVACAPAETGTADATPATGSVSQPGQKSAGTEEAQELTANVEHSAFIGLWKGQWNADAGSSGRFELNIKTIGDDGLVDGLRMYVTSSGSAWLPTIGQVEGNTINLDLKKGSKRWIRLQMSDDRQNLNGRYSAQNRSKSVFQGDISTRKQGS